MKIPNFVLEFRRLWISIQEVSFSEVLKMHRAYSLDWVRQKTVLQLFLRFPFSFCRSHFLSFSHLQSPNALSPTSQTNALKKNLQKVAQLKEELQTEITEKSELLEENTSLKKTVENLRKYFQRQFLRFIVKRQFFTRYLHLQIRN